MYIPCEDSINEAAPSSRSIENALRTLSHDTRDYSGSAVRSVAWPTDELSFYREFVASSVPCKLQGALQDWPALELWTADYLAAALQASEVPVAVTPNGRADAVTSSGGAEVFALPAETKMRMSEFFAHLCSPQKQHSNVLYIQQQNNCLREEFAPLLQDIQAEPEWAVRVFGGKPEAVNLWIGGAKSVTSFHKDHYENLFAVISGVKTFTLLPPADIYRLAVQYYTVAQYSSEEEDVRSCPLNLVALKPPQTVQWSPIDPSDSSQKDQYPLFFDSSLPAPMKVTVKAGEMLYLPSLWHHYVEQTPGPEGLCIAVNMWFDMAIDFKFAYFTAIEKIAALRQDQP